MPPKHTAAFVMAALALPSLGAAQSPLSAIEWLGQTPQVESTIPTIGLSRPSEPSTTQNAATPEVSVVPLTSASPQGAGLLPSNVTGFPPSIWQASGTQDLTTRLEALPTISKVPAVQSLVMALLLAEATPPGDDPGLTLFKTRMDALIARGALAAGREMLGLMSAYSDPGLDALRAELALIDGDLARICQAPPRAPELSVICLAQKGQWDGAAASLETRHALGDISKARYHRLWQFLDPEFAETAASLPPPRQQDLAALDIFLLRAIGEGLPGASLPLAFAAADLSGDAGWRAELEAAERLVRSNALPPARLFEAYTRRVPAASGGVWDRAASLQTLETSLQSSAQESLSSALLKAATQMEAQGLITPFAAHVAPKLDHSTTASLSPEARHLLARLALLTSDYEAAAISIDANALDLSFEVALAQGAGAHAEVATLDPEAAAIAAAWADSPVLDKDTDRLIAQGKIGEAMLRGAYLIEAGVEGDLTALTHGLSAWRRLGLEDAARRAALQIRLTARRAL